MSTTISGISLAEGSEKFFKKPVVVVESNGEKSPPSSYLNNPHLRVGKPNRRLPIPGMRKNTRRGDWHREQHH